MPRFRKIAIILAIVFGVVAAYRILGVYEFRSGECAVIPVRTFAPTYPKRLVVMTFNIEGHASLLRTGHIAEVAAVIRKYQPDIVGINEAHRNTWQARFGDHLAQLEQLTGMRGVFGRSYIFAGGEFGNAVLTRGEILSTDVYKLPGTGEPRSLLDTVVRVNGGTIEFYVTHTTAWASLNEGTRDQQMQCVNAHLRGSRHPYILTGDFNAPPESPEISRFLGTNQLQFAGDPKQPTHRVMEQRLDYILVDSGWQIRSSRVLEDGPSDHRPVLAELVHP